MSHPPPATPITIRRMLMIISWMRSVAIGGRQSARASERSCVGASERRRGDALCRFLVLLLVLVLVLRMSGLKIEDENEEEEEAEAEQEAEKAITPALHHSITSLTPCPSQFAPDAARGSKRCRR